MSEIIRVRNRNELARALEQSAKDERVDIRGPGFHVKRWPIADDAK